MDATADPWAVVRALADQQGGVVSRRQLYAAGLTRWQVKGQLRAGRWQRLADQSVCLHNGPVGELGQWWAAVFQGGPRACLDGASALVAGGLERFSVDRTRVSVPRGAKVRRTPAYDIRQTRRWDPADLAPAGIPRTRPDVAAIRAALWAKTDRQATYLLTLTVQQGIAPAGAIAREALRVRATSAGSWCTPSWESCSTAPARWLRSTSAARCGGVACRLPRGSRYAVTSVVATTWTSTGRSGDWSWRSTASTTPGSRTSSEMPSDRTRWPSPATRSCGSRSSARVVQDVIKNVGTSPRL